MEVGKVGEWLLAGAAYALAALFLLWFTSGCAFSVQPAKVSGGTDKGFWLQYEVLEPEPEVGQELPADGGVRV